MVLVKKMPGDTDDTLIRKFSRKVIDAGIIPEAKRRQFHLKPSLARKMKKKKHEEQRKRMPHSTILLFVESRYKVDRKRIIKAATDFLSGHIGESDVEVSVAIVGDRKMRQLNKIYRNLDKTSNVLSFPISEGETIPMPSDKLRLGDVVISYPEVIRESAAENFLVDDRIEELVLHGITHLLGIHHE